MNPSVSERKHKYKGSSRKETSKYWFPCARSPSSHNFLSGLTTIKSTECVPGLSRVWGAVKQRDPPTVSGRKSWLSPGRTCRLAGKGATFMCDPLTTMKSFRLRSLNLCFIRVCNVKWQGFFDILGLTVLLQQHLISSICILRKQDFQALLTDTKLTTKGGKNVPVQRKQDFFVSLKNILFQITVVYYLW